MVHDYGEVGKASKVPDNIGPPLMSPGKINTTYFTGCTFDFLVIKSSFYLL